MKIESIHVDGFGVWNNQTWESLEPGLNIFHGRNETGKSTLMAFVRSILFGFDRRGSAKRYEPLNGGNHGGWLDLIIGERHVRIERKTGRHVRGTVAVTEGDVASGDETLDRLLGGTTRTLYHNVFAFGLEELEHFHTLQDSEVATHISGAGLGVGAARWAAVQRDIEERQSDLFLPRGQNSTINVAFKELDAVRDDLDRTEQMPQDYWAAHEARTRLGTELAALEDLTAELKKRVDFYEKRRNARPMIERRRKLKAHLQSLPPIDSFPEGGIERLNLILNQIHLLESELRRKKQDLESRRASRAKLAAAADPDGIVRRTQIIESLKNLVPRVEAARRIYKASLEERDAIEQEKASLDAMVEGLLPPSKPAFLIFLALLWGGAAGLFWLGYVYTTSVVLLAPLLALIWYRGRVRSFEDIQKKISECATRLSVCKVELKRTEVEAREIESDIRRLTGHVDITAADIAARSAELDRLFQLGDELRKHDEATARSEGEVQVIEQQLGEARKTLKQLLVEAAASDEADFLQRAEIFKQRQLLSIEIERIPLEGSDIGFLFDMHAEEDAAYEIACKDLAEAEQRLIQARHETGRMDERIATMERSEERTRALEKQERVLARLDLAAEQWAVLTLCRAMLDETRRIYETERQPEVLRQASAFFGVMTEGRYVRVFMPLEAAEIQVERADGLRFSPQVLSRGTAEQLYLAMRLALVREYANHVDALPVVFDDIFVNFDPERTRSSIRAVRELSATHQVLLFTCHPHLVQIAQEIVPSAKVFPLQ